jgi:two-component system, NtrC family, response regulator HydG
MVSELNEYFKKALLETVPCAVFVVDNKYRIIYWNKAIEGLTGYTSEDVTGLTCEQLRLNICATEDPKLKKEFCPLLSGSGGGEGECEITRKDGSAVPVIRRSRAVFDCKGDIIGAIEVLVDVSTVKQARDEIRVLRHQIAKSGSCGGLIGRSQKMLKLYDMIEMVAATDASIVIEGATGTGKELVARTIHCQSSRRNNTFLAVNCGAVPEPLLEAELFGHKKGSFTGSVEDRAGCFEAASGGTLFLDEIGDMPASFQVKLLRVLQDMKITRVGDNISRSVNVRVLSASNKNLTEMVKQGLFREDLYYRLRVVGINVPSLEERKDDIPLLVGSFIRKFNDRYGRKIQNVAPEAIDVLLSHNWPGNVRELEHAIEHSFVVTPAQSRTISIESLPAELLNEKAPEDRPLPVFASKIRDEADEKQNLLEVLEQSGGNKTKTAQILGITRSGLYKKMRRLGLIDL